MLGKKPGEQGEANWENGLDPEAILKTAGGSLAVGVIDRVMSVKDLIDSIIGEAEEILSSRAILPS